MTKDNFKVGDIVLVYSEKQWCTNRVTVNGLDFTAGFVLNPFGAPSQKTDMEASVGKPNKVMGFDESGGYVYLSLDIAVKLPLNSSELTKLSEEYWSWDYCALEKVITKEENPEYFL